MNKRIVFFAIVAVLSLSVLLSSCGEKNDDSAKDKNSSSQSSTEAALETTAFLETTGQGGTVEKDSDGNVITKDQNGKVTEVKDKDGKPIEVSEYLITHSWVENPADAADSKSANNQNGSSSSQNNTKQSDRTGSDSQKSGVNADAVDTPENDVEGSIPVVIATMPDKDELDELPILD